MQVGASRSFLGIHRFVYSLNIWDTTETTGRLSGICSKDFPNQQIGLLIGFSLDQNTSVILLQELSQRLVVSLLLPHPTQEKRPQPRMHQQILISILQKVPLQNRNFINVIAGKFHLQRLHTPIAHHAADGFLRIRLFQKMKLLLPLRDIAPLLRYQSPYQLSYFFC